VYAQELHDQICLENADRTGFLQLTTDPAAENYYPSFAPDGKSVVYVSNRSGEYEIYELDLATRTRLQLTHNLGEVSGPAISPDGSWIVFADNVTAFSSIWKMRRDGSGPHQVFARQGEDAVDPSWSPDGTQILFALGGGTDKQLYTIHPDGTGLHRVNADFRTRGRSSWSPDGTQIASYAGSPWNWGMYLIAEDGSGVLRIPVDGVALAPAFSPDGSWIVFTGYLDHPGDPDGCEIYVMRLNGSQPSRMTYNNYCDYQPRWGP
jgi:TolB protein